MDRKLYFRTISEETLMDILEKENPEFNVSGINNVTWDGMDNHITVSFFLHDEPLEQEPPC